MKVYVDNNSAYSTSSSAIDTYISMSSGKHSVVVQSWDSAGAIQKSALTVSVGTASSSSTSTSTSTSTKTFTDIEQMTGWSSCDACAGAGGVGPTIPYSMTQGQSSPAMDGNSTKFSVGGDTPYSNALWWKQLGANNAAANFVYDVYFYIKDPNAPQALEFDVNQANGTYHMIFGTECSYKQSGSPWQIWDGINERWVNAGVSCPKPLAYSWNHLTWEFQRVGSQTRFVSVTLNGNKSYINRYYGSKKQAIYEINVAFQMDKNVVSTDYTVWLDNVSLKYW
jgi:hypothetical protein